MSRPRPLQLLTVFSLSLAALHCGSAQNGGPARSDSLNGAGGAATGGKGPVGSGATGSGASGPASGGATSAGGQGPTASGGLAEAAGGTPGSSGAAPSVGGNPNNSQTGGSAPMGGEPNGPSDEGPAGCTNTTFSTIDFYQSVNGDSCLLLWLSSAEGAHCKGSAVGDNYCVVGAEYVQGLRCDFPINPGDADGLWSLTGAGAVADGSISFNPSATDPILSLDLELSLVHTKLPSEPPKTIRVQAEVCAPDCIKPISCK